MPFSDQEIQAIEMREKELEAERLRRMTAENNLSQMSSFNTTKDSTMMEYQLDLDKELDRIYHLLSGHVVSTDPITRNVRWEEPEDDRLKIFSDYGVKQIMNIISFYINRNTLLSNYDEETIYWKVKDFGIELHDLIFNRYEAFFYYPSPEELFDKYKRVAEEKGIKMTEAELYAKCVQWSREELQSKFRHYPMIILALIDSVHTTFLRAMNGEERRSLRKQIQIHESLNSPSYQPQVQNKGFLSRFGLGGGK